MTSCTCAPPDGTPRCDRSENCPSHNKGVCTRWRSEDEIHFDPAPSDARRHKDCPMDCSNPACEWPTDGNIVTALADGMERTGSLGGFEAEQPTIRTSSGDEYEIAWETIREPDWGTYCRHGLKIIEAVPAEHTRQGPRPARTLGRSDPFHECTERKYCPACYSAGRKVEPWPCQEDGCTEDDFDREQEQEIDEYYKSLAEHARADW